jgi:hypothetical protein
MERKRYGNAQGLKEIFYYLSNKTGTQVTENKILIWSMSMLNDINIIFLL